MTNEIIVNYYAHECELNVAGGICNWRMMSAEQLEKIASEKGEGKGISKCLYDIGGIYAGKRVSECACRKTMISNGKISYNLASSAVAGL